MSDRRTSISRPQTIASRYLVLTAAIIGALAIVRFVICWMGAAALNWSGYGPTVALLSSLSALLIATALYYACLRQRPKLGMALLFPGLFLLSAILSLQTQFTIFYLGRHHDLIDDRLAAIDVMLGFDWTAYCLWMFAHPIVERVTTLAYGSIWLQPLFLTVLFAVRKRLRDYLTLWIALPLSFVITCIVAAYLPALGAYQFHGMTPDQHAGIALEFTDGMTAPMLWLRQGDVSLPMPDFPDLRLITFPSWHAAAAAIFMRTAWPLRGFRWAGLLLNLMMLASTPVQGSHYLTDILVGLAIGALSCWVAYGLLRRPSPRPAAIDLRAVAPT